MIIDYELAKFKHEAMMYFWYYKLGFNDSSKLYKQIQKIRKAI